MKYLRTGINDISKVNIDTYMERFDKNLNEFFRNNSIVVNNNIKTNTNIIGAKYNLDVNKLVILVTLLNT